MGKAMIERRRRAEDDVVSASAAAQLLGMTRQAVDKGLRDGRIPGFRDPHGPQLWVERAWLLSRIGVEPDLERRVRRLETHTASQEQAAAQVEADLASSREVNLLLLAAAAERDRADKFSDAAQALELAAAKKRRKAAKAHQRSTGIYRDAISQTQLPGTAAGAARKAP